MKVSLVILIICFSAAAVAQGNLDYQKAVARAGLFHLQKNAKSAVKYYEKAFQLKTPEALDAYKAAGAYALEEDTGKAFHYLNVALSAGWTEAGQLALDPYFDPLKKAAPGKWKEFLKRAVALERKYESTLAMPALRKRINRMALEDQQLRYRKIQSADAEASGRIDEEIRETDHRNYLEVKQLIQRYGWPGQSVIGKDGQHNLWLIVQHADHDVLFQQAALAEMQETKAKDPAEINPAHYAFLYDRVQCNLNYKQLYGTQVVWSRHGEATGFRPIIEEDKADERRKMLNMPPLEIYALGYGFNYDAISAEQARQNLRMDSAYTRRLIDSAEQACRKRDFQRAYDAYNRASMVLGGMDNAANYTAAVLFARIAAMDNDPKYRGISLDFLNLLYLRGALNRKQLQRAEFGILQGEERWQELLKDLAAPQE